MHGVALFTPKKPQVMYTMTVNLSEKDTETNGQLRDAETLTCLKKQYLALNSDYIFLDFKIARK